MLKVTFESRVRARIMRVSDKQEREREREAGARFMQHTLGGLNG